MGNETFYWDGQNNSVLARYSPHEIRGRILAAEIWKSRKDFGRRDLEISAGFWPPRFSNLGRILAAEIPRDLGRILAAEI